MGKRRLAEEGLTVRLSPRQRPHLFPIVATACLVQPLWNLAAWHQRAALCGARWAHVRFKRAGRCE